MAIPLWSPKPQIRNDSIIENDEIIDDIISQKLMPLNLMENKTQMNRSSSYNAESDIKCVSMSLGSDMSAIHSG